MSKYCIMPFASVRIEDFDNKNSMGVRPCCYYRHDTPIKFDSLEQYLQSDFLKNLQTHLLTQDHLPPGCQSCAEMEKNNLMSVRKLKNRFFEDQYLTETKLQELDLFPSNLCNLNCLMCGPKNSSAIAAEQKKLGLIKEIRNFDITDRICDALDSLDGIEYVTLAGGEVFYLKRCTELLQKIKKANVKNLKIITNGTVHNQEHIKILSTIPNLVLRISVDGAGDQYEMVRYPNTWQILVENVSALRNNLPDAKFECAIVLQPLNVFSIFSLLEFCQRHQLEPHIMPIHGDPFGWKLLNQHEKFLVERFIFDNIPSELDPKTKVTLLNWAKNVLPSIEFDLDVRNSSLQKLSLLLEHRKFPTDKIISVLGSYPELFEDFKKIYPIHT